MSSEITHAGLPAGTLAVAPNWRREVRDTLILTAPIAAALLAEMGMGVIDYSMSGHLDPLKHPGALAAAGLGLQWLFTPMFWGMGVITATGAIGAQAHGGQDPETVSESMRQGFLMATVLSIPIMAIAAAGLVLLPMVNGDPEVVRRVREIVFWGLPWIPLVYWFTVVRNFVTVMQRPMIVSICAVAGLPVSFLSNYVFMYGNWGAPEMGVAAVGLTGVIVALLHLVMIVAYVQYVPELRRYRIFARLLHFDRKMMVELFRVGIPIGMAYLFETGLFFTITVLMGVLSTEALTAHNAVLNVCAVTFMIPYALSQAATVRVGYAVGAGQPEAARRAGYVAVWLGMGWMMLAAATMLIAPSFLTWIYMDLSDAGECVGGAARRLAVRDRRDLPDRRRHAGDDPGRAARAQGHHHADGDLRPRLLGVRPRQRRHHGILDGLRRQGPVVGPGDRPRGLARRCCSCAGGACRGA